MKRVIASPMTESPLKASHAHIRATQRRRFSSIFGHKRMWVPIDNKKFRPGREKHESACLSQTKTSRNTNEVPCVDTLTEKRIKRALETIHLHLHLGANRMQVVARSEVIAKVKIERTIRGSLVFERDWSNDWLCMQRKVSYRKRKVQTNYRG